MKRKLRKGYCNCGREVQFSNSIIPYKMECPLCGAMLYSRKTLTGKLVIYSIDDECTIKTVVIPPKGKKLSDNKIVQ